MPGYEVFGKEEQEAINELFKANGGILFAHSFEKERNGVFKVREFEKALSKRFNSKYAQAVSSGSAALRVALAAIGVGRGDEVIIPSFTFVATAEAVIASGADLVIVDIDDTLNMDPESLNLAISEKTKVIIPVHMMGAPADMTSIMEVARKYSLHVVEDAAQGVGGSFRGKKMGTIGDLGCYSFDAGKTLITGEGGMVVTNKEELFKKSRAYHDHGHEYSTTVGRGEEGAIGEGFNFRMTEIHAAIGLVQLGKLDSIISAQRENKKIFKDSLVHGGFPFMFRKILDHDGELGDALIMRLPSSEKANQFAKRLSEENIGTKNVPDAIRWHFSKHWSHMFKKYGWYSKNFSTKWEKSANILESSVALPVMVKMSRDSIYEMTEKILRISKGL